MNNKGAKSGEHYSNLTLIHIPMNTLLLKHGLNQLING